MTASTPFTLIQRSDFRKRQSNKRDNRSQQNDRIFGFFAHDELSKNKRITLPLLRIFPLNWSSSANVGETARVHFIV
jgi:hypothetical protein